MTEAGISVVGVRDNPRFSYNPAACVQDNGTKVLADCVAPVDVMMAPENPAAIWDSVPGYTNLDFTDLICPDGECQTVVGNVLVWLDGNHLTMDYMTTVAAAAEDRIVAAVEGGTEI